ncbi:MAG: cysteine desulfurase family protein [bacterium]|nr:cysteine desulfurase family protein [bacterium]
MEDIYLDYAAATPLHPEVQDAIRPLENVFYGNPGSLHFKGLEAYRAITKARETIATILRCQLSEIVFTSGGTESINLALQGVARQKMSGHIITTAIEHVSVLETCRFLEHNNFEVTYIKPDQRGLVNVQDIRAALRPDTILVSVMYANNEIGTIQPIAEIGAICHKRRILFHTDACQAAGVLDLNVNTLQVDLLTLNGSKIYGPKGIGLLYVRNGVVLQPIFHGGGQERGIRSGTENVAGIVGLAKALEIAQADCASENERLSTLRDYLVKDVIRTIPKTILNGDVKQRLPNNVNITFLDIEGEALILHLNELGIYAATGSACNSKKLKPSHVLTAIGVSGDAVHGSIRFTLGRFTKQQHLDFLLAKLPSIVEKLRQMSPINIKLKDVYV